MEKPYLPPGPVSRLQVRTNCDNLDKLKFTGFINKIFLASDDGKLVNLDQGLEYQSFLLSNFSLSDITKDGFISTLVIKAKLCGRSIGSVDRGDDMVCITSDGNLVFLLNKDIYQCTGLLDAKLCKDWDSLRYFIKYDLKENCFQDPKKPIYNMLKNGLNNLMNNRSKGFEFQVSVLKSDEDQLLKYYPNAKKLTPEVISNSKILNLPDLNSLSDNLSSNINLEQLHEVFNQMALGLLSGPSFGGENNKFHEYNAFIKKICIPDGFLHQEDLKSFINSGTLGFTKDSWRIIYARGVDDSIVSLLPPVKQHGFAGENDVGFLQYQFDDTRTVTHQYLVVSSSDQSF